MSKGYPDFFGYSFFPSYGKMSHINKPTTPFATGNTETIFDFTSKAIIQGGYVGIDGSSNAPFIRVKITIDGDEIFNMGLNVMLAHGLSNKSDSLAYLQVYGPSEEVYALGFKGLIPVESSYKVEITNNSGDALTVRGDLNYSIIKT